MRLVTAVIFALFVAPLPTRAELVNVSITRHTAVANGQPFGTVGPYEHLTGSIEFALDPADTHNRGIADLDRAVRGADGKVHFTADLHVIRPVDAGRGNGVLLFGIANRGVADMLSMFNNAGRAADGVFPEMMGNGFLMRQGYTLVWVGWEFDVAAPRIRIEAPAAPGITGRLTVRSISNGGGAELTFGDAAGYRPARADDSSDTLTVRDSFWDTPAPIARSRWAFVTGDGAPRIHVEGGVEPGRIYELLFTPTGTVVAGVGLAAIRDAASAFRYRSDLPIQGRATYVFGSSQSGRFLRQFLADGFNADERNRKVFDAVWAHIAGAARGSFNDRFATPTSTTAFAATREPFLDADTLRAYRPEQLPKIVYTNTPVEYWGEGRAAALVHTRADGTADVQLPDNVRVYFLAGTQHGEAAFPPTASRNGQQLPNPVPQREVMRALLTGLHQWVAHGTPPPVSQYPRLADRTLTPANASKFPAIPGVHDPRTIDGPGLSGRSPRMLPFLVPQVDADGNDVAGIRVPDQAVPLATTTGWNFRGAAVGNPDNIYALLGSYIPFSPTRAQREARGDPRLSVEERYPGGRDEYLGKIRAAAEALVKGRYLLQEDVESVLARARAHWEYATAPSRQ